MTEQHHAIPKKKTKIFHFKLRHKEQPDERNEHLEAAEIIASLGAGGSGSACSAALDHRYLLALDSSADSSPSSQPEMALARLMAQPEPTQTRRLSAAVRTAVSNCRDTAASHPSSTRPRLPTAPTPPAAHEEVPGTHPGSEKSTAAERLSAALHVSAKRRLVRMDHSYSLPPLAESDIRFVRILLHMKNSSICEMGDVISDLRERLGCAEKALETTKRRLALKRKACQKLESELICYTSAGPVVDSLLPKVVKREREKSIE